MRLTIIFLLLSGYLKAQEMDGQFLYVSGGIATGIASFSDLEGGAASSGFNGDIFFQSKPKVTKSIGYTVMIRKQTVDVDRAGLEQQFSPNTIVTVTQWAATSFLVGFNWTIRSGKRGFFQPKLLFGIMLAESPTKSVTNATIQLTNFSSNTIAFANLIGVNYRYDLSSRVSLIATFDYEIGFADFNVLASSAYSGQSAVFETAQKIVTLNTGLGVGYRF